MNIEHIAKIESGRQDGAVWNGYLFCFDNTGRCSVFEMSEIESCNGGEAKPYSEFCLNENNNLIPHSNSVMFGNEYYSEEDEFPLLYANIYNNYANSENSMKGICAVYRLQKKGNSFTATHVQIIEIAFVDDVTYWKSSETEEDVRPYGNFTIDNEKGIYYAFTMRDKTHTTRFFAFDLPKLADGEVDDKYGVRKVKLNIQDIKEYFDCSYHHFMQGACCYKGKIYSTEGFTDSPENPPVIRIINPSLKEEESVYNLVDYGLNKEPEMIEFYEGKCYYGDDCGNIYKLSF